MTASGGDLIAEALHQQGVRFIFTLCGGHISPILVSSKRLGIRIVDVRDEASAAFAADAVSRLTGVPGVVAVTAGPGLTNTITAIKNAQLAQSPVVLLGGATGTILKGRGSLQDIDQEALLRPHVGWMAAVGKVRDLVPAVERAFVEARRGVPGPVFVECPVDLLYQEEVVRPLYGVGPEAPEPKDLPGKALRWYLNRHLRKIFGGSRRRAKGRVEMEPIKPPEAHLAKVVRALERAERPVALVGSQAVLQAGKVEEIARAVETLGIPVYLSGMARGLLGADSPLHLRHKRRETLKRADLVLLFGVPSDFRLDYGRHIPRRAKLISVNLSPQDLSKNRRPTLGLLADPGTCLLALADLVGEEERNEWLASCRARDEAREEDIASRSTRQAEGGLNPLALCKAIDAALDPDSVLVTDGGDFIGTAAYTVRPRGPLRWLDPGVFGTLGVGGGFAVGAKCSRPDSEVWLLYGDGSSAYSLAEFDTYVRHGLPVIAVVGNDASWMQIAREQVDILGDSCGTDLLHTDYHKVAEGYGGRGFLLKREEDMADVLAQAKALAREGTPVLINAILGKTDFRKGSISM